MKKLLTTVALLALFVAPSFAQSLGGSYVNLVSPTTVDPGDTGVVFQFYVWNASTDAEWVTDVVFTFPSCFTVTAGSYTYTGSNPAWTFTFTPSGYIANFNDGDAGYGEIYGGDGGTFFVTVNVGVGCPPGPATVHWSLTGDDWGSPPHFVEGDVEFTIGGTATEVSTWSSVKALY